jgi:hypothetical protein
LRGGGGRRHEGARGGSFRQIGGPEELLSAVPEPPPGGEAQEELAGRHGRRRHHLCVCGYVPTRQPTEDGEVAQPCSDGHARRRWRQHDGIPRDGHARGGETAAPAKVRAVEP